MKYMKKEKSEYEVFHIRIPVDLATAIRHLSDKSQLSLNATIVRLVLLGVEIGGEEDK